MALVVSADFYRNRAVLVTGGTGFIGGRLVTALRQQNAQMRILIRANHPLISEWPGMTTLIGDLNDPPSLARACVGIDTVFHAAGFAHADAAFTADFAAQHWAVNAEGTFQLVAAARAAQVKRLVFLSSVKAVGEPGKRCVDESWKAPPETPYGQAKRVAEEQVTALGLEGSVHTVNLRPALVYGPGMKANLARLLAIAQRGWLPLLPDTGNRRSLVHVDDVVQAALLAAAYPAAAGKTYFVTDGQCYSGHTLSLILRQAYGHATPKWALPAGAFYGAAAVVDGLLRLTGRRGRRTRAMVDKLLGWACYDASQISAELGYRPLWTLERYCQAAGLQK